MKARQPRWREAQVAEKNHAAHSEGFWPKENVSDAFNRYFDATLSELDGSRVLEVGSGTGMVHSLENVQEATGIDPLTHEVSTQLEDSVAHLITGVGEQLPFPEGRFDAVIHYNVLDHTANPHAVLKEIRRVTEQGGSLFFGMNTFKLPEPIRRRLGMVDRPHPHHFSTDEATSMIEGAGYQIDHLHEQKRYDTALSDLTDLKVLASLFARIRWACVRASAV